MHVKNGFSVTEGEGLTSWCFVFRCIWFAYWEETQKAVLMIMWWIFLYITMQMNTWKDCKHSTDTNQMRDTKNRGKAQKWFVLLYSRSWHEEHRVRGSFLVTVLTKIIIIIIRRRTGHEIYNWHLCLFRGTFVLSILIWRWSCRQWYFFFCSICFFPLHPGTKPLDQWQQEL